MTEELEQTTIERVEKIPHPIGVKDGKTIKYCLEFKFTWEYKFWLSFWAKPFNGVYPLNSRMEKIFLKSLLNVNRDNFLELLVEVDSNPRMKKTINILTTKMEFVRSETEPTNFEWYFRISDFYNVKVDKGDKSHIEFLKSDKLKNELELRLSNDNYNFNCYIPSMILARPTSVEVTYRNSYFSNLRGWD
jgi:hypothetical protein